MKLDVLAFAAHPDDAELACSGTLIKLIEQGKKVGIVDLTQGELGTRGSAELRLEEAKQSAKIMGLAYRGNLDLGDGWFKINRENKLKIIAEIRRHQPEIVLANAIDDRHTDHPKGGELVKQACFLSGLSKIETTFEGEQQERWRPNKLFHYIQYYYRKPDFVVDISNQFDTKIKAIQAFQSQFYDPSSEEESTLISSKKFFDYITARAREFGSGIEVEFGEGFNTSSPLEVDMLDQLK